jgi:hypothetical protein
VKRGRSIRVAWRNFGTEDEGSNPRGRDEKAHLELLQADRFEFSDGACPRSQLLVVSGLSLLAVRQEGTVDSVSKGVAVSGPLRFVVDDLWYTTKPARYHRKLLFFVTNCTVCREDEVDRNQFQHYGF